MNFDDYQIEARKTAIYPDIGFNLVYPVLGLNGEAGEVAEKIKKLIRDDSYEQTSEFREAIAKELGDVLWYVAAVCSELGISMSLIAADNIAKLTDRSIREVLSGSGNDR